jgi:hypothetical protein
MPSLVDPIKILVDLTILATIPVVYKHSLY